MVNQDSCDYKKKVPVKRTNKCLTARQILNTFQDAVVTVTARFLLLGEDVTNAAQVEPSIGQRADIVVVSDGFIHCSGYIITPASAVVAPPAITAVANIAGDTAGTLGQIKEFPYTASQILVTVNNVNGGAISHVYEAELYGYYGKGDFALLRICDDSSFNHGVPTLNIGGYIGDCGQGNPHPSLQGIDYLKSYCSCENRKKSKRSCGTCGYDECSASTRPGDKVFLLGHGQIEAIDRTQANTSVTLIEGYVADVRHTEKTGWFTPESLIISADSGNFSVGMPVLNSYGRVVGMQTADYQDQFPIAGETGQLLAISWPSIYIPMQRLIKNQNRTRDLDSNIIRLPTLAAGTIGGRRWTRASLYSPGYLGISYQVMDGSDYTSAVDYTSGNPAAGKPAFALNADGSFLRGTSCKDIQGILVTGVAGLNPNGIAGVENGYWFVPGGVSVPQVITPADPLAVPPTRAVLEDVALFPPTAVSPLLGLINPGDIIVTIEFIGKQRGEKSQFYLGSLQDQINPQMILDRFIPGDLVRLSYRKRSDLYSTCDSVEVTLGEQPTWLNYPHYATARFPDLSGGAFLNGVQDLALARYPAFQFPPGLVVGIDFQVPSRNAPGSAVFAPSI